MKQVDHTPLTCEPGFSNDLQQYPNLFKEIRKLKHIEVKLHIDQTVSPVALPAHRIPCPMRKCIAAELDSLERQG